MLLADVLIDSPALCLLVAGFLALLARVAYGNAGH